MPGAGKSAVALKISSYFNIRCFAKDEYKEILFDTYGFKSRAEKVKLGTMAMEMMYVDAEESMKEGNLFILDNNFENSSKEGLYELLNKLCLLNPYISIVSKGIPLLGTISFSILL